MTQAISRCVRMDDWIFEIKMVRALKVDSYGQPYKAIAHFNINGDFAFLDGALHASQERFSDKDIETFKAICRALDVSSLKMGEEEISAKADVRHISLSADAASDSKAFKVNVKDSAKVATRKIA